MEKEEVKKDLTPESKVENETINVKIDTSELKEVLKGFTDEIGKRLENIPGPPAPEVKEEVKAVRTYSLVKAIREMADPKGSLTGLEKEMHEEADKEMKNSNLELQGLGVPTFILSGPRGEQRADLKASVDASGGYTVATELPGLIDTLKNSMVTAQAGANLMTGLVGDIAFPRAAANSTATWRSEGGLSTQSDPTFEQVTLTPKRLTTHTEYTHQLLRQSTIDIESFVRNNLYYSVANALETAVFSGSGSSNQPQGIFADSSVNNGDHGSNGTILSWANIVKLETMIAVDNALQGKPAYITNATAAGKMKQTLKSTYQGGYIWEIFSPVAPKGMVNGYDAYVTNVISNALTRGTGTGLSAVVFGDWTKLMIGQWGGIDLIVNPYSLDTYGTIRVTIAGYYDIKLEHSVAFAAIEGLET